MSHSSLTQTSLALDDVRRNLKRLATGTNNTKQQQNLQQHTPTSTAGFRSFPPNIANDSNNNEPEEPGGVVSEREDSQILDQQLVAALERASSYSEANAILHRLHTSRQQRAMKRAIEEQEEEKRNGNVDE